MRILGWLLLVGGLLLCVSIVWAAPGFFCMGLGLIFLQIAERKRRKAKTAASLSDQSEPQAEQAQIPESTRAVVPPETEGDAGAGRENVTGPYSYDRREWRALLSSDADISRLANVLESYGQKYVDEFAAAFLAVNDKDYLPAILQKIVASASRDSRQNIAGDFHEEDTNPDPVAMAFNKTRRIDRVREKRVRYVEEPASEKSASADSAPGINAAPERELPPQSSGGDGDISAAWELAAEEINRKAPPAEAASDASAGRQVAVEEKSPQPPKAADAATGRDEKKSGVDAVDADNLTEILDRLNQAPKTR
jgi:hypothetical protein